MEEARPKYYKDDPAAVARRSRRTSPTFRRGINRRRYDDIRLRERPGWTLSREGVSPVHLLDWRERVGVVWLRDLHDPRRGYTRGPGWVRVWGFPSCVKVSLDLDGVGRLDAYERALGEKGLLLAEAYIHSNAWPYEQEIIRLAQDAGCVNVPTPLARERPREWFRTVDAEHLIAFHAAVTA